MSWLYRTEFKSIQTWILSTDKLRELAGGSNAIEMLVDGARKTIEGMEASVETAAAGGITAIFASRDILGEFASVWPMHVDHEAPGLSMIQAWVDMSDRDAPTTADWHRLQRRLGEARNRMDPALPVPGPLVARAGRSGGAAVQRGVAGLEDRTMNRKGSLTRGSGQPGGRAEDYILKRLFPDARRDFIFDLDDLGEGYVAVVHIDANGVGARLQGGNIRSMRGFSQALAQATTAAARQSIEDAVSSVADTAEAPFGARPVVLGGDDFTIVCRGDESIRLAQVYLETFEKKTERLKKDLGGAGMHACAGIVMARSGWPFSDAYRLAEDLCAAAKSVCKQTISPDGTQGVSGLAFHRVTTSLTSDWKGIRESELSRREPTRNDVLTANPYTLEKWAIVAAASKAAQGSGLDARGLPRGALRVWSSLARTDEAAAQRHWERMRDIATERHAWAAFGKCLEELGVDPSTGWERKQDPVGAGRTERRTPVPDIVEHMAIGRARRGGSTS